MTLALKQHLSTQINNLSGNWVRKNCNYESDICRILGMNKETVRYWDATWGNLCIEFKKGRSIWLDLVRYSEVLMKIDENASKKTISLFFIHNIDKDKNKHRTEIVKIIAVDTSKIIEKLHLDNEQASALIELHRNLREQSKKTLNAQVSMTVKQIEDIADFIVNKTATQATQ